MSLWVGGVKFVELGAILDWGNGMGWVFVSEK